MTLQAGGALWHMPEFFGWFAFKAAGYDAAFAIDYHGPGFVLVNAAGQRFCDETGYEVHERLRALVNVKPAPGYYPALPVYGICDGADAPRRSAQRRGRYPERLPVERRQPRPRCDGAGSRGPGSPGGARRTPRAWIRPC